MSCPVGSGTEGAVGSFLSPPNASRPTFQERGVAGRRGASARAQAPSVLGSTNFPSSRQHRAHLVLRCCSNLPGDPSGMESVKVIDFRSEFDV